MGRLAGHGIDTNAIETRQAPLFSLVAAVFVKLVQRLYAPVPYWRFVRAPSDRNMDRAIASFRAEVYDLLRDARRRQGEPREGPGEPPRKPAHYLDALVANEAASGSQQLPEDLVFNHVAGVLMESVGTLSNAMGWSLHFLVRYPEHLARIRDELDQAIGRSPSPEDWTRVDRFPFLCAFSNEVLRLKPSITFSAVEPIRDVEILGHHIPRDTVVIILHRHPAIQDAYFANPDRFRPERWLPDAADRSHPYATEAYIPFGAGSRSCPGKGHSMHQIRVFLAMFCANFEPVLADGRVTEDQGLTMMPSGLRLRLKRRSR